MNLKEQILQGIIPADLRILDAHAHLGDGEVPAKIYLHHLPAEETVRISRQLGVDALVASAHGAMYGDAAGGNERMMEYTRLFPGYVYASMFYAPQEHEVCMEQIEKYRRDPGFVGVKIHPSYSKVSLGTDEYDRLYDYCCANDILLACHTWTSKESDPVYFEKVLQKFPELKLQMCHMGGTYRGGLECIRLANKYPRVYLDINGTLYSRIWLEEVVKQAPFERFIFGTDQTYNDPTVQLGRVLLSDLSDEQKRQLLCDNFEKIIGRRLVPAKKG